MLRRNLITTVLCLFIHYIELRWRILFYKRWAARPQLFVINIQETGTRKTNDKMNHNKTQYKQDWQSTRNITLWRIRVTTVAAEISVHSVCAVPTSLSTIHNIECCTTMLLYKFYVASDNKSYVGHHVKCPMLHWNIRTFICFQTSLDMHLAKQIVMILSCCAVSQFCKIP
jgi:hypothetical protein